MVKNYEKAENGVNFEQLQQFKEIQRDKSNSGLKNIEQSVISCNNSLISKPAIGKNNPELCVVKEYPISNYHLKQDILQARQALQSSNLTKFDEIFNKMSQTFGKNSICLLKSLTPCCNKSAQNIEEDQQSLSIFVKQEDDEQLKEPQQFTVEKSPQPQVCLVTQKKSETAPGFTYINESLILDSFNQSTMETNSIAPIIEFIDSSLKNSKKKKKVIKFERITQEELTNKLNLNVLESVIWDQKMGHSFDLSMDFDFNENFEVVKQKEKSKDIIIRKVYKK